MAVCSAEGPCACEEDNRDNFGQQSESGGFLAILSIREIRGSLFCGGIYTI